MRVRKILCLGVEASSRNAKLLAQDLVSLQSQIYHMTKLVNFLDQHPDAGHTNYELNRFGMNLAEQIKTELREHPSKKAVKFYVDLLDECWKLNNYELGARVYQGIHDAITRDEVVLPPGVYDMPLENPKDKEARAVINAILQKTKKWADLKDKLFPSAKESKELYITHLEQEAAFIPSIQALMNFIAIRLDNAKNIIIDHEVLPADKYTRLLEIKNEILNELIFIEEIILKCMPTPQSLHFPVLEKTFEKQLALKFRPTAKSCGEELDKILKLSEFKSKEKKVSIDVPAEEAGSSAKLFARSPRKKKRVQVHKVEVSDIDIVVYRGIPIDIKSIDRKKKDDTSPRGEEPETPKSPSSSPGRKG